MPKKPARGGKRSGAGRPRSVGATERRTISLTPEDLTFLVAISINLSKAIRILIARSRDHDHL